jgi:3-oxoacyl-[acyl-carrier-protein] synthase-3
MKIKITGIGSYIPEKKVSNIDFNNHVFLNEDGNLLVIRMMWSSKKFKSKPELSIDAMLTTI